MTESVHSDLPLTAVDGEPPPLVIERSSPWRTVDLAELWRYRELLYFFVWRDVKVRYKQTVLGVAWAVIQPLMSMLILAFVFGRLARLPSEGVPYAIFAYAGLLPWTFFANALSAGSLSLFGNSQLLTKVYFPRILIPISAVTTALVDFALAALMLLPLCAINGVTPPASAISVAPAAIAVCLLVAYGAAIWTSALVVRYWDLRHVIPFAIQMLMFATPVVYPLSIVPRQLRWLVVLNPIAGVVEAFRASVLGRPVDLNALAYAGIAGIVLIVTGSLYFRSMERTFADVI